MINLSDYLSKDRIIDLTSTKKDSVLKEFVYSLSAAKEITDINLFYKAILEREKIMSTGIGSGVAIPHVKIPQVKKTFVALGRKKEGIDFDSLDGKPVYLVILVASSDKNVDELLMILAKISLLFKDAEFKKKIIEAKTARGVFELLKDK